MRFYIFRDIYSGKIYGVRAYTPMEAVRKLAQLKRVPVLNLARITKQHAMEVKA